MNLETQVVRGHAVKIIKKPAFVAIVQRGPRWKGCFMGAFVCVLVRHVMQTSNGQDETGDAMQLSAGSRHSDSGFVAGDSKETSY